MLYNVMYLKPHRHLQETFEVSLYFSICRKDDHVATGACRGVSGGWGRACGKRRKRRIDEDLEPGRE